jgi:hypothetical protein
MERRGALFSALRRAFPTVTFEPREAKSWAGLDALIELGGASEAGDAAAAGTRALAMLNSEGETGKAVEVLLASDAGLDRRLRGQVLPDTHLPRNAGLDVTPNVDVLATAAGRPLWTRAGPLDIAAIGPLELSAGESLRARCGRDRSLALLPLLELLRALTSGEGWQAPPLRATFLLDDPNLHWPSYGYLKLPQLARHAARHRYHLALAMVPLDAWFSHPAMNKLLRGQACLSLLVHGNNHFGAELGRATEEAEALALAAQARRRIAAFERRTGVAVSPVMVPPHEECSETMTRALSRSGFDAITMTRPYPWLSRPPRHWLTAPAQAEALAGWRPADLSPGNLPVLLRHPLSDEHFSSSELVLRAYLDQPLILYGHHGDLAGGLDVLARRTEAINRLGPVQWAPLGEIAATNVEWRLEGDLLRLRPYGRRIAIEAPDSAARAVVELPAGFGPDELIRTPNGIAPANEPFAIGGSSSLDLMLEAPNAIAPHAVPTPPPRPWPIARRIMGEARDRIAPAAGLVGVRR